jgi:hypothetical protein
VRQFWSIRPWPAAELTIWRWTTVEWRWRDETATARAPVVVVVPEGTGRGDNPSEMTKTELSILQVSRKSREIRRTAMVDFVLSPPSAYGMPVARRGLERRQQRVWWRSESPERYGRRQCSESSALNMPRHQAWSSSSPIHKYELTLVQS